MRVAALALVCAGAALLVGGVAWVYPPAGLIVAGLLCLAAGYPKEKP